MTTEHVPSLHALALVVTPYDTCNNIGDKKTLAAWLPGVTGAGGWLAIRIGRVVVVVGRAAWTSMNASTMRRRHVTLQWATWNTHAGMRVTFRRGGSPA